MAGVPRNPLVATSSAQGEPNWLAEALKRDFNRLVGTIQSGVMAPANALSGQYDTRVVDANGNVEPFNRQMIDDAANMAGVAMTGSVPIPKPSNAINMGVAYHGTPHIFTKFDSSKIGTGEGAQAYGHGLYFAGNKEVAKWYRDVLSAKSSAQNDVVKHWVDQNGGDWKKAAASYEAYGSEAIPGFDASTDDVAKMLRQGKPGRLLTVDIPGDDDLLTWDAPLSEQSDAVKKALGDRALEQMPLFDGKPLAEFAPEAPSVLRAVVASKILKNGDLEAAITEMTNRAYDGAARSGNDAIVKAAHALGDKLHSGKLTLEKMPSREIGSAFYDRLRNELGSPEAASKFLREAGIPGHRFLDQGSRPSGEALALIKAQGSREKALALAQKRADEASIPRQREDWQKLAKELERPESHNYVIYDDTKIKVLDDGTVEHHNGLKELRR
jgi:hypothetical protein